MDESVPHHGVETSPECSPNTSLLTVRLLCRSCPSGCALFGCGWLTLTVLVLQSEDPE